jgi:phage terminase large subunit-like protein
VIRARVIQALASVKSIIFPKHAPWREHVEKQLLQFPSGKHDDAVDVLSLIGRGLEHVRPAKRPAPRPVNLAPVAWNG